MRIVQFAAGVGVGLLLVTAACQQGAGPGGGGDTAQKLEALETRVATLEQRNADLMLKSRIVSGLFSRGPLADFFASPEFWENTYDSGQADCARRCIATLQAEKAACPAGQDPPVCLQAAVDKASACQTQCSKNFPPPIN